jgi:hypothetical protein
MVAHYNRISQAQKPDMQRPPGLNSKQDVARARNYLHCNIWSSNNSQSFQKRAQEHGQKLHISRSCSVGLKYRLTYCNRRAHQQTLSSLVNVTSVSSYSHWSVLALYLSIALQSFRWTLAAFSVS